MSTREHQENQLDSGSFILGLDFDTSKVTSFPVSPTNNRELIRASQQNRKKIKSTKISTLQNLMQRQKQEEDENCFQVQIQEDHQKQRMANQQEQEFQFTDNYGQSEREDALSEIQPFQQASSLLEPQRQTFSQALQQLSEPTDSQAEQQQQDMESQIYNRPLRQSQEEEIEILNQDNQEEGDQARRQAISDVGEQRSQMIGALQEQQEEQKQRQREQVQRQEEQEFVLVEESQSNNYTPNVSNYNPNLSQVNLTPEPAEEQSNQYQQRQALETPQRSANPQLQRALPQPGQIPQLDIIQGRYRPVLPPIITPRRLESGHESQSNRQTHEYNNQNNQSNQFDADVTLRQDDSHPSTSRISFNQKSANVELPLIDVGNDYNMVSPNERRRSVNSPLNNERKRMNSISKTLINHNAKLREKQRNTNETYIDRMPLSLDNPKVFYEDELKRSAAKNKRLYMKNFCVEIEYPAVFVQDAKIYPFNPVYNIQLVNYSLPQSGDTEILNINMHAVKERMTYKDMDSQGYHGNLILRLSKRSESSLEQVDEYIFRKQRDALIKFDTSGSLFAYYLPKDQTLRIVKIEEGEIKNLMKKLKLAEKDESLFHLCYNGCTDINDVDEENGLFDLSFVKKILFDQENRFFIAYGDLKVFILNIETAKGQIFSIHHRTYQQIYDLNFKSSNQDDFECYIACKKNEYSQICVFDITEHKKLKKYKAVGQKSPLSSYMEIQYKPDIFQEIYVKISNDFQQVAFANGLERHVYSREQNQISMKALPQLKERLVRHIYFDETSNGFYFLVCKDYDKYLSVEHSERDNMDIRFNASVEPGRVNVLDFDVREEDHEIPQSEYSRENVGNECAHAHHQEHLASKKMTIRTISMLDDIFVLDKVNYTDAQFKNMNDEYTAVQDTYQGEVTVQQENIQYLSFSYSPIGAYSINWPFLAFSGLNNSILIVNTFERKQIQRVQVAEPEEKITIHCTFFTYEEELMVLMQKAEVYYLYMIVLRHPLNQQKHRKDDPEQNHAVMRNVFQYDEAMVEHKQFKQMYIRGTTIENPQGVVEQVGSNLQVMEENQLLYLSNQYELSYQKKKLLSSEIKRIQFTINKYLITTVCKECDPRRSIKDFNADQDNNSLMILSKIKKQTSAGTRKHWAFSIYDCDNLQYTFDRVITHEPLIGRLKSGLYTFVSGHIYYNNNVIKLRYDLIHGTDNPLKYNENETFDYYDDILKLNGKQKVKANTPLVSFSDKKFAYILQDKSYQNPNKLLVVPILQERRMMLNKVRKNYDYFFTRCDVLTEEERLFKHFMKTGDQAVDSDVYEGLANMETPRQELHLDRRVEQIKRSAGTKGHSFAAIISINLSSHCFHSYQQNGLLISTINLIDYVRVYGKPIASSNNGLGFIFKKDWEQLEQMEALNSSPEDLLNELMTISIFYMSVFGITFIKKINILERIKETAEENCIVRKNTKHGNIDDFKHKNNWLLDSDFNRMIDNIEFKYQINDKLDVCIRLRNKETFQDKQENITTIYVFEHACHGVKLRKNNNVQDKFIPLRLLDMFESKKACANKLHCSERNVWITKTSLDDDFNINDNYIFFRQHKVIQMLSIKYQIFQNKLKNISLDIDMDDAESYVKSVKTGVNPEQIVIVVNQNKFIDTIFVWDTYNDIEREAYDVEEGFSIIWDEYGDPYIITPSGSVVMIMQRCAIKSFQIDPNKLESENHAFGDPLDRQFAGIEVDGLNHNWLIHQNHLYFPFSYMTFVIKEKIENNDLAALGNIFDPEAYNYIFNRSNCFIDGDFVYNDHACLQDVLNNFASTDIQLLELLHYVQKVLPISKSQAKERRLKEHDQGDILRDNEQLESCSALHKALQNGNNRSVDIILGFMAKIKQNSSENFESVLNKLIDLQNFKAYLQDLPIETIQMQRKQTLRLMNTLNDQIVSMSSSSCQYFDEKYFELNMKEIDENIASNCFPVKVVALNCGWILNKDSGYRFLRGMLMSEDLEYYDISTIQMLIEFLYQRFKFIIYCTLLPLYVASHVCLDELCGKNDHLITAMRDVVWENTMYSSDKVKIEQHIGLVEIRDDLFTQFGYNGLLLAVQSLQMCMNLKYMKLSYFKRFYSGVDIGYVAINVVLISHILVKFHQEFDKESYMEYVVRERLFMVLSQLLLYFKFTYFLSMIDEVAPLIDIIAKIIRDIKYFMVILLIYVLCFATCFTYLAQNQVDFDELSQEELDKMLYKKLPQAFYYVFGMVYGSTNTYAFAYGEDPSQYWPLTALFVLSVSIILIHFLNLLIAIMANTFEGRMAVANKIMVKDHLKFVMDNWFLLNFAFRKKKRIRYIVTAFLAQDEQKDQEILKNLKDDVSNMSVQMKILAEKK